MKITKRQLRKIIKEVMVSGNAAVDNKAEAALVLRYTATYLFAMRSVLRKADLEKYREGYYPGSLYMDITNFWKTAPVKQIKSLGHEFTADRLGTDRELVSAEAARAMDMEALAVREDYLSSVTEKIDDLITYLYDQTPMGMSAIEAAKVYGKDIRPQADLISKFFNDRVEYFSKINDSSEFDR